MTLSDLERRDARGRIFLADLHNYARVIRPRIFEFGKVTQLGNPSIQKIFGTPTTAHTG